MNPETKLTENQIKAICIKHDIDYVSHSRISAGFSHEVHRLNDDLIIKIFNSKNSRNFQTESALLSSNYDFLKPKLVACHQANAEFERSYIIMSFIEGISLGSTWHMASDTKRETLIAEISKNLKVINTIDPAEIRLENKKTWEDSIFKGSKELTAKLLGKKIIEEATAAKVVEYVENNLNVLKDSPLYPVYWDIHFDNFIINENFELQAIIDLENVELTSLDYPLFVIKKMMDDPVKYLRLEDEKYAKKEDYIQLERWYRKYYPEMFAFDNLDKRVEIYEVLDTLHLLKDWSHVTELPEKLKAIIGNT